MSLFNRRFAAALLALTVVAGLFGESMRADEPRQILFADPPGRKLFVERWAAHDKRSPDGDGLGPMHNATSCAACHHQSGPGGGGDRRHNVELLSIVPVESRHASSRDFVTRLIALHPGFKIGNSDEVRPNLVLHRFGPEADYFDFRARLLRIEEPRPDVDPARRAVLTAALARRRPKAAWVETLPSTNGVSFKLSQRNTPALWGAGLIDAIADTVIQDYAAAQKRDTPDVAGRVPRAGEGGVGRFGWRGQTATLRQFVLMACANELGLQTKDHLQPVNPLNTEYKPTGADMSEADIEALVAFVANLPRPIEAKPATSFAAESARKGEKVFERIGCADCHPRTLGKVNGLFSDLLLHDLGPALEDPVEPNPEVEELKFASYSGNGSIFVEKEPRDPSLPRQWRTPPLWGVSDSAPYLHDGRAETLAEAITQHSGQASASAAKFRNLPSADRANLIAFLETLKAPPGTR
jgi:CxxC motif-containing protein (DUF1111 family)